jgi:hypothetical protein
VIAPLAGAHQKRGMSKPSAEDIERIYPQEEWVRDLDFWFSRGSLSIEAFPQVLAYYRKMQAGNPKKIENSGRMWMTLAFLQSNLPELVRAGAAVEKPGDKIVLPPALITALYRAFMSPVATSNPRGITLALILEVVKEQKEWNEDRK